MVREGLPVNRYPSRVQNKPRAHQREPDQAHNCSKCQRLTADGLCKLNSTLTKHLLIYPYERHASYSRTPAHHRRYDISVPSPQRLKQIATIVQIRTNRLNSGFRSLQTHHIVFEIKE